MWAQDVEKRTRCTIKTTTHPDCRNINKCKTIHKVVYAEEVPGLNPRTFFVEFGLWNEAGVPKEKPCRHKDVPVNWWV